LGHDHCHHDHQHANQRRLTVALTLAAGYCVAEAVGGWLTNSLALLADAGHMLSDVAALGLSLFAAWIARRPPTSRRTFGYYRAEILAALVNGATLVGITLMIFVEAYRRLHEPPEVAGAAMMTIAVGGLVVNLLGLAILSGGRQNNLNIRGAWLHTLTDALGSVGAIAAGAIIWVFQWNLADPLASSFIGLLVIYSSWMLLSEALAVLMEHVPRGIDPDHVRDAMIGVPGVAEVHDLHIWTITSGLDSLSAHVVAVDYGDTESLLRDLRETLHNQFGIEHITIQIEPTGFEERTARV
jgi:cobalt-zinc-cadmium efflux system protein